MTFSAVPGDLLSVKTGIIVHGCNARGVMNSGVARAIRQDYPAAFEVYQKTHDARGLVMGEVVWHKVSDTPPLAIANAITQKNYGRDPAVRYVDYDAVRAAMTQVGEVARKHGLMVHYPRIGAGLGNGDWPTLLGIIQESLTGVQHRLWVPPAEWNPTWDGPLPSVPVPPARRP